MNIDEWLAKKIEFEDKCIQQFREQVGEEDFNWFFNEDVQRTYRKVNRLFKVYDEVKANG